MYNEAKNNTEYPKLNLYNSLKNRDHSMSDNDRSKVYSCRNLLNIQKTRKTGHLITNEVMEENGLNTSLFDIKDGSSIKLFLLFISQEFMSGNAPFLLTVFRD